MEPPYDTSQQHVSREEFVNWPRVAAVSAMVSFSIPTFMTGIELFTLLSWQHILLTLIIGGGLLTLVGGLMGSIGAITRKNSYMLVKVAFGEKGAKFLNILFAISLIGWFGLNLDLFSSSVITIISPDNESALLPIIVEALAGTFMIVTTIYGFNVINRLSSVLVPIMVVVSTVLLYQSIYLKPFSDFIGYTGTLDGSVSGSVSQGVSLIVGVIIIGAIILPDITRFSRQTRGGVYTAFWSYLIAQSVVVLIAAYAAFAFNATNILKVLLSIGIGSGALLIVIAGSWILNALNLYSAELAVTASLSSLSHRGVSIALGIAGMFAAFVNILDLFVTFLSVLTVVFIPVAGIIAVDFFLLNKGAYAAETPAQLVAHSSNSASALIAWAVGASIAGYNLFAPLSLITGIAAVDAIIVSALLHLTISFTRKHLKPRHAI